LFELVSTLIRGAINHSQLSPRKQRNKKAFKETLEDINKRKVKRNLK